MTEVNSCFQKMLVEITKVFIPFKALNSPEGITWLLREIGWELPGAANFPGKFNGIETQIFEVERALDEIIQANEEMEYIEAFFGLEEALRKLIEDFYSLTNEVDALLQNFQDFKDRSTILDNFVERLLDYLIVKYLQDYQQKIYSMGVLAGLIELRKRTANELHPYQPVFIHRIIYWDKIPELLSDPFAAAKALYKWGADFDAQLVMASVEYMMRNFNFPGGFYDQDPQIMLALGRVKNELDELSFKELRIPIFRDGQWPDTYGEFGVNISPVSTNNQYDGIAATLYLSGSGQNEFDITDNIAAEIKASTAVQGLGLVLRPENLTMISGLLTTQTNTSYSGSISLTVGQKSTEPKAVFALNKGTQISIKGISIMILASCANNEEDIGAEVIIDQLAISVGSGGGDGLLDKILPDPPFKAGFALTIGISKQKGFYIKNSGKNDKGNQDFKIEYAYNANISLGPINLTVIDFILDKDTNTINLIIAVSLDGKIGPVSAAVSKVGIKLILEPGKPGIFGKAALGIGFKPPSGVGIAIDVSVVKGGGYLEIENDGYSGALQLDIVNKIAVTAFGIITNRLPDGSSIFAFKIFASAQFPPIQLGYGFILTGVGLTVAINCTMNVEALRNSVYTKSLSAILFPNDPIKNAPKIINDLKTFFPVNENSYVVGAMIMIGWGGATALIKAEAGIFIEFGSAFRIAIAGIAHCELPSEDSPVIALIFSVIGIIDITGKMISIDASFEGSKLLDWPLNGDVALRAGWGENAIFAFSAGGFYPGYKVPQGFPELRRLSITIGQDNPKIGLYSYLAVTENSVQFGAKLEFHYQKDFSWPVGNIELDGGFSFDAIIIFSPFSFEAGLSATISLKRNKKHLFGIYIAMIFKGPNNYRVKGKAEFEVIGIGLSIDFDETFGDKLPEPEKPVLSPYEMFIKELEDIKNWSINPSIETANKVLFRKAEDADGFLDTNGGVVFRQKSIPLGIKLEKLGEASVKPGESIVDIQINDGKYENVEDMFVPGQFENLSQQEKISRPPFEKFKSGLSFSQSLIDLKQDDDRITAYGKEVGYETKIAKPKKKRRPDEDKFTLVNTNTISVPVSLEKLAMAAGQNFHVNSKPVQELRKPIVVSEPKFAVISNDAANGKFQRVADGNMTYTQARQVKKEAGGNIEIAAAYKAQ